MTINKLQQAYQQVTQYLNSANRRHSEGKVVSIALSCIAATAVVAGCAAFKGLALAAVGCTLSGVALTVCYCMHQLYLQTSDSKE